MDEKIYIKFGTVTPKERESGMLSLICRIGGWLEPYTQLLAFMQQFAIFCVGAIGMLFGATIGLLTGAPEPILAFGYAAASQYGFYSLMLIFVSARDFILRWIFIGRKDWYLFPMAAFGGYLEEDDPWEVTPQYYPDD